MDNGGPTISVYMTKQEYSNAKRRLTLLTNNLKRALAIELPNWNKDKIKAVQTAATSVIGEVNKTLNDWTDRHMAYPDDWHRWERAKDDAVFAQQRFS